MKNSNDDTRQLNTAIYIRLSREDGDKDESNSVTHQREILLRYIRDHSDLKLYDEYVDDGYSGTNFQRPGFERMLSDIKNHKISCILVKDLSRFARDYVMAGMYIERYFPQWDIRFISISENYDSDNPDIAGQDILLPIQNLFNEFHARDTSRKVQRVMHQMQEDGKCVAAFAPYGYQKDHLDKHHFIVDPYAAEVVKRIFRLFLSGMGMQTIAKALNVDGILCPSSYKEMNGSNYHNNNRLSATSYWTESTVKNILKNETYIGTLVQGKTIRSINRKPKRVPSEQWVRVADAHEAIIDKVLFEQTQILLSKNTRSMKVNVPTTLFAGLIKCGDCGRSLVKTVWNDKITYRCGTYKRIGSGFCTPHAIRESVLTEIVLNDLNIIIGQAENLTEIVRKEQPEKPERNLIKTEEKLQSDLEKCIRKKAEAYDDYKEGLLTKDEFLTYGVKCNNTKKQLALQLQSVHEQRSQHEDFVQNPWLQQLLHAGKIEELDKQILLDMIETIFIYENQTVRIVYRFSDELDYLFRQTLETVN
ncbi:recombinase family protein [Hespellia stercorisuis]|uniref:Site-specific DNA recombinase n=1 Tax=Hespellia stercorisuis DSM 15480 TaxID=1121950 RepID=A0A1M6NYA3_9FIRM|nr:recombinase family protein [Hespellia stercorisuis]SHK00705.1 Site-specific DNA recombinase [Hespellia stercorisuis DSM 15480]